MALLTVTLLAGFYILTMLASEIGLPAVLTAMLPIPLSFVAAYGVARIMRTSGAL